MNDTERTVLGKFKAALQEKLGNATIILFGSRARRDAEPFSDMDLVVILEGEADERSRDVASDCAREAGFDVGIVVVPVVFGKTEWEAGVAHSSLLGKAVAQEGLQV